MRFLWFRPSFFVVAVEVRAFRLDEMHKMGTTNFAGAVEGGRGFGFLLYILHFSTIGVRNLAENYN